LHRNRHLGKTAHFYVQKVLLMPQDDRSAPAERISAALQVISATSPRQTDGQWLERMAVGCAPLIKEWDVSDAWLWQEWPDLQRHYPNTGDIGIDVVARRRSDGELIAIEPRYRIGASDNALQPSRNLLE